MLLLGFICPSIFLNINELNRFIAGKNDLMVDSRKQETFLLGGVASLTRCVGKIILFNSVTKQRVFHLRPSDCSVLKRNLCEIVLYSLFHHFSNNIFNCKMKEVIFWRKTKSNTLRLHLAVIYYRVSPSNCHVKNRHISASESLEKLYDEANESYLAAVFAHIND